MSDAQGIQVLFATYAVAFNNLFDKICDLEKAIKKLAGEGTWTIAAVAGGELEAFGATSSLPVNCYAVQVLISGSRVTEFGYGDVQNVVEGGWISFIGDDSYLIRHPVSFGNSLFLVPEYENSFDIGIDRVAIGIPIGVTGEFSFITRVFVPTPTPTPTPVPTPTPTPAPTPTP